MLTDIVAASWTVGTTPLWIPITITLVIIAAAFVATVLSGELLAGVFLLAGGAFSMMLSIPIIDAYFDTEAAQQNAAIVTDTLNASYDAAVNTDWLAEQFDGAGTAPAALTDVPLTVDGTVHDCHLLFPSNDPASVTPICTPPLTADQ